ncbi:MAG TPA: phospholipase D-like domain-containing protein [Vicinamibacterales bacterium]|nr:phospholipase D-like domain-containing protein [Vicinamibacterales bacterium]
MKLIIQPEDGAGPVIKALDKAKKTIDVVIFRFDRSDIESAIHAAIKRGVVVRALIAHTNKGGEKNLRKLELRLLEAGATVARTADDLTRYHGKMLIVDGTTLHVYGFNYTKLDIDKSRSFGIVTRDRRIVSEAIKLFDADALRQTYTPGHRRLVVSPENSRAVLTEFIKGAKQQLLIYDAQVSDNGIQKLLQERADAGVEIRILGKLEKSLDGVKVRKLSDLRLHVRAIVRDAREAFIGSQSLRRLELDGRREVGVIIKNGTIVRRIQAVFEADWRKKSRKKAA